MPSRRSKRQKKRPKRPRATNAEIDGCSVPLADLGLSACSDDEEKGEPADDNTAEGPERDGMLGALGLCPRCHGIYESKISRPMLNSNKNEFGIYLDSLSHIQPNSPCKLCRFLCEMRCGSAENDDYHLHVFSAFGLFHKTTLKAYNNRFSNYSNDITQDAAYFAVLARANSRIRTCDALDLTRDIGFFAACAADGDGNPIVGSFHDQVWRELEMADRETDRILKSNPGTASEGACGSIQEMESTPWWLNYHVYMRHKAHKAPKPRLGPWWMSHVWTHPPLPQTQAFSALPVLEDYINFSRLREWLKSCMVSCQRIAQWDNSVPLYLIDCWEREVVEIQKSGKLSYAALSYVWGAQSHNSRPTVRQIPYQLPARCPSVVEDALTVTTNLSIRYLWVDAFCISSDESFRHQQISRMDLIYKNAAVTIIAGAGDCASHGLPGVSTAKRKRQPSFRHRQKLFVSTLPDPTHQVEHSTYSTRGWTYQEQFLSRHQLIFTDRQVFFQCPKRRRYEAIDMLDSTQGDGPMVRLDDEYLSILDKVKSGIIHEMDGTTNTLSSPHKWKVPTLAMFEHHISQYSGRKLTYETDALDAISSILDRFSKEDHAIEHMWGIPFIPEDVYYLVKSDIGSKKVEHDFGFAYGLCWTHGASSRPIRRRKQFPSWSWLGWEGPVTWLANSTRTDTFQTTSERWDELGSGFAVYQYEGKSGEIVDCEKWRSRKGQPHPTRIRVEANWLRLSFEKEPASSSNPDTNGGLKDAFYLEGGDFRARLHVTRYWFGISCGFSLGVALGCNSVKRVVYLLVVDEVKDGVYERMGVIQVPLGWYQEQRRRFEDLTLWLS